MPTTGLQEINLYNLINAYPNLKDNPTSTTIPYTWPFI